MFFGSIFFPPEALWQPLLSVVVEVKEPDMDEAWVGYTEGKVALENKPHGLGPCVAASSGNQIEMLLNLKVGRSSPKSNGKMRVVKADIC